MNLYESLVCVCATGQSYKLREPMEPTNEVIVLGGKGRAYTLRDSRIIQIAGRWEMFSLSQR